MSKHQRIDLPGRSQAPHGQVARVLIVDDSLVVRSVLERILTDCTDIEIVGAISNAAGAVDFLQNNSADIIVLDIEMPNRSGLDALPEIISLCGDARVLVLSSLCENGGPAALKALSLGACDTLAKPGHSSFAGAFADTLRDRLRLLMRSRSKEVSPGAEMITPQISSETDHLGCIVIGSSTGGIPAIHNFLRGLSDACVAPILIAQHLPATFMPFLARQLQESTHRVVRVGEDSMVLKSRQVYLAPGHAHMVCKREGEDALIELREPCDSKEYTPAVDPLFDSAAEVFGGRAAAVVLSGMGRDGLLGAEKIRARGGSIYVQDLKSSVVWGMPGVVARAGLADAVLPAKHIAEHISTRWQVRP